VKTNGRFAPAIIVKVLAKLILDEPDVVFVAGDGNRILINNFPQSKAEFDDTFCASTSSGKLSCKFEIRSSRNSFHAIKIGVWDILKESQVWLKKSPGPVRKTPLTAIGFLMNVHPGFASSRVFHSQILDDIDTAYDEQPDLISDNKLPTTRPPAKLYLCRRKITADYSLNDVLQPISSDALMVYVPTAKIELALIYLTKLSTLGSPSSTRSPMFIPLKVKYLIPENSDNMSPGITPFCMITGTSPSLVWSPRQWMPPTTSLANICGTAFLLSLESTVATPAAGLQISANGIYLVKKESHQRIADWIDENLMKFWSGLPGKTAFPVLSTFPKPERLSKGRRVSSGSSVISGLTNASPVEDYFRQLESSLPPQDLPSHPNRNVWKNHLPIGDISYSFNTANFPKLVDPTSTTQSHSPTIFTSPATGSVTHGATAVSTITEGMVSHTVKSSITAFENRRMVADDAFAARMAKLELQVEDIRSQVTRMTTQISQTVIATLTAGDGIIK
jgi:hypothetical protein